MAIVLGRELYISLNQKINCRMRTKVTYGWWNIFRIYLIGSQTIAVHWSFTYEQYVYFIFGIQNFTQLSIVFTFNCFFFLFVSFASHSTLIAINFDQLHWIYTWNANTHTVLEWEFFVTFAIVFVAVALFGDISIVYVNPFPVLFNLASL